MLIDLLSLAAGESRARDLLKVLEVDPRLDASGGETVPKGTIAAALHFLLFEELLKRSPTALSIAGEALQRGEQLTLDHAALATIDTPHLGSLGRGRHHLGQILEPLGYVQFEAHDPDLVPDFVIMELHALRFDAEMRGAIYSVFGGSPSPNHVRVQAFIRRLESGDDLKLEEAAELLQGLFAWFGRQHVPPLKSHYATLAKHSDMAAWMAHEGQGISHMTIRVAHLSATLDAQLREDRELQPVRTSLDQAIKLVGLVPDAGPRPFRDVTERISQDTVPIANLAFIERGADPDGPRFEPGLF